MASRSSLALLFAALLCVAPALADNVVGRKVGPTDSVDTAGITAVSATPAPTTAAAIVYENCGAAGATTNRPCTCATAQEALTAAVSGVLHKPTIVQLQPEVHVCNKANGVRVPDALSHVVIQGPTTFDGQNKAKFLMMLTGKQVDISIGERNGNGIAFNNAAGAAIVIGGGAAKITVDTCTFSNNLNGVNGGGAIHAVMSVSEHSGHAKHVFPGGSNGLNVFRSNFTKNVAGAGTGDQLSQGGAIFYTGRQPFRLADCVFTGNKLNTDKLTKRRRGGGAVYSYASSGLSEIQGCTFTGNAAQYGGALFLSGAHKAIYLVGPDLDSTPNTFASNVAAKAGDSVYIEGLMNGHFKNNVYDVNTKAAANSIAFVNTATGNMTDCGSTFAPGASVFSNPGGLTINGATNAPAFTPIFNSKKNTAVKGDVCSIPESF
ncbi:hypothetical protein KFL_001320020 [Klebsormidium nitens]|uniref:Right handed beta helix domain-containing protein n=1 Tax=Klebsormidium nitens TaxID=105231 RepID=A0A1Y1HWH3_KLENI|nr:hypothetical protein KFL_001320020 [Klebsormidium nitens]|eukprot:GAQ82994.1 hypothetical protein KFL_001320020 [Klebsormidium nitens]